MCDFTGKRHYLSGKPAATGNRKRGETSPELIADAALAPVAG
jgi:hypothetical protein